MLPNFLIIGAAKCGTTSLYHQLRQHPDIFMPENKEPTFFSDRLRGTWNNGLQWYEQLFKDWQGEAAVGEASTSYSKAPYYGDAPEKIARIIPQVKLIYLIRDPISQLASHYRQLLIYEGCRSSFDEVILGSDFLLDVACYYRQISHFLRFFSRDQILILFFEEYINKPIFIASRVSEFLAVDNRIDLILDEPKHTSTDKRIKRWPGPWNFLARVSPGPLRSVVRFLTTKPIPQISMDKESSQRISDFLLPDIDSLKAFLHHDKNFKHWKTEQILSGSI